MLSHDLVESLLERFGLFGEGENTVDLRFRILEHLICAGTLQNLDGDGTESFIGRRTDPLDVVYRADRKLNRPDDPILDLGPAGVDSIFDQR